VSSLSCTQVERVAAGLWHTLCITTEGCVYAFGGNQFGQLGTGADQAEVHPFSLFFMKKLKIKFESWEKLQVSSKCTNVHV
jgi:alpha-tubulin suppressor-like RCC1 family protein